MSPTLPLPYWPLIANVALPLLSSSCGQTPPGPRGSPSGHARRYAGIAVRVHRHVVVPPAAPSSRTEPPGEQTDPPALARISTPSTAPADAEIPTAPSRPPGALRPSFAEALGKN